MKKASLPILTRAESEVMAALWKHERLTVHALVEALERPVAYTTALTLLRILHQKGYAKHEPDPEGGRAYVYLPAIAAEKARRSHVRDLVDRLFNGRPEELVTGLLEDERLSRAQLQLLREQIEKSLGPQRPSDKKPRKDAK
jgi:predicted transcriptional regulator